MHPRPADLAIPTTPLVAIDDKPTGHERTDKVHTITGQRASYLTLRC